MAKTREQKKQIVDELVDKINDSKSLVFADFHGLNVDQSEEVRKKCYEEGVEFKASKKTLLKLALDEAGLDDIDPDEFEGGVAVVFGFEDQVKPAKITADFSDEYEPITVYGGVLEKSFISDAKVKDLAELPSKQELKAKLVRAIAGPMSGLVNSLDGPTRGLVQVLNSVKEKKED